MARPRTQLGTWGKISLTPFQWNEDRQTWTALPEDERPSGTRAGRWRARSKVRDLDGRLRDIERWGDTKADADAALRAALRDRVTPADKAEGALQPDTTVEDASKVWLREVDERDLAQGTRTLYAYAVANYVLPSAGALALREVKPPNVDRLLRTVHKENGPASAKTTRAVLSGILGLAVRHGAIHTNPVRQAAKLSSQPSKTGKASKRKRKAVTPRALTAAEVETLRGKLASSETALRYDTADLITFMLGTGCRVGEASAIRRKDVDLEAGTVEIAATVVRVKGQGLQIQERPKTAAGWRVLALPPSVVEMLRGRIDDAKIGPDGTLLASAAGKLRDPSNTADDLRRTLDPMGFEWVTSHTFRKTAATRLDEAGLSARKIADQLGHARPSLTQDVYMGRKVVTREAAELL